MADELEGFEMFEGSDQLQKIPLFRYLSFDETTSLASLIRKEKHPAGKTIVEQGALGAALYLVVGGKVRVERVIEVPGDLDLSDNRTEVLGHLGEGQLFGEMSLIDDMLTSARIVSETEVELLLIDRLPLEKLLASNDKLAVKIYRSFCWQLSHRVRHMNEALAVKSESNSHT